MSSYPKSLQLHIDGEWIDVGDRDLVGDGDDVVAVDDLGLIALDRIGQTLNRRGHDTQPLGQIMALALRDFFGVWRDRIQPLAPPGQVVPDSGDELVER